MSHLDALGLGALLAWVALPLLAFTARSSGASPAARHRQLVAALALDVALFFLPLAMQLAPTRHLAPATSAAPAVVAALKWAAPARGHGPLFWLGAAWAALTALAAAHAVWRLAVLGRILRRARVSDEAACLEAWQLARRLGLPPPRLVESAEIGVPFAWSVWRPAIALPTGLRARLSPRAFGCVLRHELEHLARGDQGWALAVAFLRLPLALHPTARALANEISLAREEAVDEAASQESPQDYARALVDVAALAQLGPGLSEAVSMSATALSRRVAMLIERPKSRPARWWPMLATALAVTAVGAYAPRVAAQASAEAGAVVIRVGEKKAIHITDSAKLTKMAVGDPSICDVRPLDESDVELTGMSAGKTTVLVWTDDSHRVAYQINVEP